MSARVAGIVAAAKLRLERARARYAVVDVAVRTFKRYSEDDGGSLAAALTYYTFLSFFPLVIFAVAALGYVTFDNQALRRDIIDAAFDAAPLIKDALSPPGLDAIIDARRRLALTGVALALYSGSGAVVALEHALNRVWHVAQEPNVIAKRVRSVLWLAVLGVAALASVGLSATARFVEDIFGALGPAATVPVKVVFYIAAVALSAGIFATAYRFLPARGLTWRDVLPGALTAAAAVELLKFAGAAYLQRGQDARNATFGAFATAAAFLVAAYLISQLTLLAAEVNAVLAERRLTRQSGATERQGGSA